MMHRSFYFTVYFHERVAFNAPESPNLSVALNAAQESSYKLQSVRRKHRFKRGGELPRAHLDTVCCRCSSAPTCPRRRLPRWEGPDLCTCENVSARRDRSARCRGTSPSTMTSLHSLYVSKKWKGGNARDTTKNENWDNSIFRQQKQNHADSTGVHLERQWETSYHGKKVFTKMINGAFPSSFSDLLLKIMHYDQLICSFAVTAQERNTVLRYWTSVCGYRE